MKFLAHLEASAAIRQRGICSGWRTSLGIPLPAAPRRALSRGSLGKAGLARQCCCRPQARAEPKPPALASRCEACYFVKRGNISYVYCKTNPRHKQRQGPKHKQGTVERPTAGFTHWTTRGVKWT